MAITPLLSPAEMLAINLVPIPQSLAGIELELACQPLLLSIDSSFFSLEKRLKARAYCLSNDRRNSREGNRAENGAAGKETDSAPLPNGKHFDAIISRIDEMHLDLDLGEKLEDIKQSQVEIHERIRTQAQSTVNSILAAGPRRVSFTS